MLTLTQVWGALLIFILCPLVGILPLSGWVTRLTAGKVLPNNQIGTVNAETAQYYGGAIAGILAYLLEVAKGVGTILLARYYFPADPIWEVVALTALVTGHFWGNRPMSFPSLVSGVAVYDPITTGLTTLVGGLGLTIFREKRQGWLLLLILFPVLTALRHQDGTRSLAVACLSGLVAWVNNKMASRDEMSRPSTRVESRQVFGLFQRDRALRSLEHPLSEATVGGKAAILSQLTRWGYPVPFGYVLPAGDDPSMLIEITQPSSHQPIIVRPSAVGESTLTASGAGQYVAIPHVTSQETLANAINQCFSAYNAAGAAQYRRDRSLANGSLSVIVQQQVEGVCSGLATSREPMDRDSQAVMIEAWLGAASRQVASNGTPERYRIQLQADDLPDDLDAPDSWRLPDALTLTVEGRGDLPHRLLEEVAFLARHVEGHYRGMPQMIEWSFDGDRLWLLQSRPFPSLSRARQVSTPAFLPEPSQPPESTSSDTLPLHGIPASQGRVFGIVRVATTPQAMRGIGDETILVMPYLVARSVPLIAGAKGLIAEMGGQLSHGATLVREYGIPTVVAVPQATQVLQDGQRVCLDGTIGTVHRLTLS